MSRTLYTLAPCEDCGSEHLHAPCGLTFAQRLRSVSLSPTATPTRTLTNYWDDEPLKDMFGGADHKEREERYMDETNGLGAYHRGDSEAHAQALLDMSPEVDPDGR